MRLNISPPRTDSVIVWEILLRRPDPCSLGALLKTTLVVPCFNEAQRWDPKYWMTLAHSPNLSLLFVDDGSTDQTRELLEDSARETSSGFLLLPTNQGKSEAVRLGMLEILRSQVDPALIGFLDADGAFPADVVLEFLTTAQQILESGEFDSVWSSRPALAGRKIERSPFRHYVGRGVATALSTRMGRLPYDTQSGLKIFSPSAEVMNALQLPFRTRWLGEVELLRRWNDLYGSAMRIWEEPVTSWREVGSSHITKREVARIARDLIAVLK